VSHEAHGRPGHEAHPTESDNVNAPALRTNGQELANIERHSVESDRDPLQAPYEPQKEPTVDRHELERLAGSVRSVQREAAAALLPRAAQLPPVLGLAPVDNGFGPPRSLEPERLVPSPAMRSRNLRGPLTIMKIVILIVSIFAVPIAYYFWAGGWDPISKPPPEMMSFASKFSMPPKSSSGEETIIDRDEDLGTPVKRVISPDRLKSSSKFTPPPPKSSSQQETTAARGEDPGTAVKGDMPSDRLKSQSRFSVALPKSSSQEEETIVARDDGRGMAAKGDMPSDRLKSTSRLSLAPPKSSRQDETTAARGEELGIAAKDDKLRAAKSVAGQTMAMAQPDTPSAQDPRSNGAVRALDPQEIKLLMAQGQQFIAAGDVVTARIAFQRAAEAGDADAAVALGATYDPTVLAKLGVVGIGADVAKARSWYQRAEKLGSPDARRRLDVLADR
jgi:hypothetical protein